jgi:flagellar biosynthesis/type III secretory pathway chaperone
MPTRRRRPPSRRAWSESGPPTSWSDAISLESQGPSLRALLEVERECCGRLLPILDAERAAAAAYDHVALLACLREREAVQAEWERAARQRRARMHATGSRLGALVADDPELAAVVDAVRRDATRVRRAQRINEGLVRAALAHVTDLLTVMRRELPESRYDRRAVLTTPVRAAGRWSA